MTKLDWIIVAFAVILALFGFRQGFIVGALSFAGFAAGAFLGTRLGPLLLPAGLVLSVRARLRPGGRAARRRDLRERAWRDSASCFDARSCVPGLGLLDGVLGAALGAALALGIVWIIAAVAAQTPGQSELRMDIQRSAILSKLNELLPPSGPILNALARLDPLPSITGPVAQRRAPPNPGSRATPGCGARRAASSASLGTACGLAIEGSGWVAAPGLVVTNAHVVAGEQDTSVRGRGQPPGLPAQAVVFDPNDDIAVLRVAELRQPVAWARRRARPRATPGAILGYPENGPFEVRPGADRAHAERAHAERLRPGPGPAAAHAAARRSAPRQQRRAGGGRRRARAEHVFAATVGGGTPGGYGVANETVASILATARARASGNAVVGTGPCTGG